MAVIPSQIGFVCVSVCVSMCLFASVCVCVCVCGGGGSGKKTPRGHGACPWLQRPQMGRLPCPCVASPCPGSRNVGHLLGAAGEPGRGSHEPDVGSFPWRLLFTETGLLPALVLISLLPFGHCT